MWLVHILSGVTLSRSIANLWTRFSHRPWPMHAASYMQTNSFGLTRLWSSLKQRHSASSYAKRRLQLVSTFTYIHRYDHPVAMAMKTKDHSVRSRATFLQPTRTRQWKLYHATYNIQLDLFWCLSPSLTREGRSVRLWICVCNCLSSTSHNCSPTCKTLGQWPA